MIFDGENKINYYPLISLIMYHNAKIQKQRKKTCSREKAIPFSARSSLILFQLEEQELCLQQLPTSIACKLRSYKYIEGWLFLHNLFWPPKKNENLLRTGALLIVSELQVRTESLLDLHS